MTIFQAIILGILFCFCRMGILYTWPKNIVLFGALLIGIILGDVPQAMIIGAAIQALYIAVIQPGGNIPTDEVLATFVAVPLALLSKMSPAVAVSLAVPWVCWAFCWIIFAGQLMLFGYIWLIVTRKKAMLTV